MSNFRTFQVLKNEKSNFRTFSGLFRTSGNPVKICSKYKISKHVQSLPKMDKSITFHYVK